MVRALVLRDVWRNAAENACFPLKWLGLSLLLVLVLVAWVFSAFFVLNLIPVRSKNSGQKASLSVLMIRSEVKSFLRVENDKLKPYGRTLSLISQKVKKC